MQPQTALRTPALQTSVYPPVAVDTAAPEPELARCVEAAVDCVCLNFRKASRAITQLYDSALEPSGLRVTQFSLLVALHLAGSATITRLARELVMDRTTLTRNLKPLEKQVLVAVTPGKDRRTRRITLTPSGRQALARALPLWIAAQSRIVGRLSEQRWNRLMNELETTVTATQRP